ncbi:MAG TPA: hypothetical protein VFK13_14805 [Gemmatimonadaceae bacterium]|nr:hypothetical protein [Gemmatimonadaceae bacterium]
MSSNKADRRVRARRGAILLEAIVAMAILGLAGTAAATYASATMHEVDRARAREKRFTRAADFLDAVALWPRADLDRHLGIRREGPWRLEIERIRPTLYVVVLSDSTSGQRLLRTSLFRRESDDAQ